jgi:hypothetical protein
MAGMHFKARTDPIATGTGTKTLLQVKAASNVRIKIQEWSISFQGTSNTAAPIQVELLRQTSAGTMGTSASTLKKDPDDMTETLQTTIQDTASSEPTAGDILDTQFVHPQLGYTWQAQFGKEIVVVGGERIAVRVVSPGASVNAVVSIKGEE